MRFDWKRCQFRVKCALTLATMGVFSANLAAADPPAAATSTEANIRRLDSATRDIVFRDRQKLLAYLDDPVKRSVICTPTPNDSYELFQVSVREELDVLWDLDIYAAKYGLSKKQHNAVKVCSGTMEKFLDNFKLWRHLVRRRK